MYKETKLGSFIANSLLTLSSMYLAVVMYA